MTATIAPRRRAPASLHERLRRLVAPPTIVLAYHRVVPEVARDINRLQVSTAHFAAQIEWLRANAHPLTSEQFVRALPTRGRPTLALDARPRVLITFDDGYADNVEHALPILAQHDVDATIFVTTAYAESGEPYWWDALEQAVGLTTTDSAAQRYAELHAELKTIDDGSRRARLAELGARGPATPSCRPATWAELRRWIDAGLAVGAHTRTHPQLLTCDDATLIREIEGARDDIRARLGIAPRTIAYPFGTRDDFDPRAEGVAAAAGFACAFANWPGNVRWARNPYALPRHLVRDWDLKGFVERFLTWCDL